MPVIWQIYDFSDSFPGDGSPKVGASSSSSVPEQKRGRGLSGPKCPGKEVKGDGASVSLKESKGCVPKTKKFKQTTLK
jgi:hypothetical protein